MNQVTRIIRRAVLGKPDRYNILTFPTHERHDTELCKTGHNFYAFRVDGMKEWDTEYAPVPSNYYTLPLNSIYQGINYDFILSQSKFGQFQTASQINQRLNIPIISMEVTVPIPSWPDEHLDSLRSMVGDVNVFLTGYSQNEWNIDEESVVIPHSLDVELFKPDDSIEREPHVLSAVNDFINRDYCCNYSGWKRVTKGFNAKLLGKTEGLSEPAPSVAALAEEYNKCQVFFNSSTFSPVPTVLLEAMACGCAVVTTATCEIPDIIQHGHNGLMSNDEDELKSHIQELFDNEDLRNSLGNAARQTILERFSEKKFLKNWNSVFETAYNMGIR